jgi:acetylxylan esterase
MKQWAGVFGYTYGQPQQTLSNNPSSGYTKYVYGPNLVGVYGTGVTHNIPVNGALDMEWFGITGGSTNPTTTSTAGPSSTSTRTSSTPASTPTGCTAPRWAQCDGQGYTGCKTCASPYKCTFSNQWYSQCL